MESSKEPQPLERANAAEAELLAQALDEKRRLILKLDRIASAGARIAHDFNNVLTTILGNISLALTAPGLSSQTIDRLTSAKLAGFEAQKLIEQLHQFARTDTPEKARVSIGELVKESIVLALAPGVACEFSIPADLWMAEVDASQMREALTELARSAMKSFTPENMLRVQCSNFSLEAYHPILGLGPGHYVRTSLQHSGYSERQSENGSAPATATSIITAHGGVLEMVSNPEDGTSHEMYLPAVVQPASNANSLAAPAQAPTPSRKRVLLLDDEQILCELLTASLEMLGYETMETYDGASAIAAYQQAFHEGSRFDLVICDLTIPGGIGGREAVSRLREFDPELKAMLFSGYSSDPIVESFREYGFCGVLPKPYEINDLGRIIAEALAAPAPGRKQQP